MIPGGGEEVGSVRGCAVFSSGYKSPSGDDDRGGREQVRRMWSPLGYTRYHTTRGCQDYHIRGGVWPIPTRLYVRMYCMYHFDVFILRMSS